MMSARKQFCLILPCTGGTIKGNYFESISWPFVSNGLIAKGVREYVDFVAMDCSITFLNDDGLGSLVGEWEMSRVEGYDSFPTWGWWNPTTKCGRERLRLHTEGVKVGLLRMRDWYQHFFCLVNIRGYQCCLARALSELDLFEKATFYLQYAEAYNWTFLLSELLKDVQCAIAGQPVRKGVLFYESLSKAKWFVDRGKQIFDSIPEPWNISRLEHFKRVV